MTDPTKKMGAEDPKVSRSDGSRLRKRSLSIAGHRTSVSLEDAFWRQLKALATRRSLSMSALIARIDAERGEANLSSAIRVYVLEAVLQ